jgi:hypothetical protein
MWIVDYTHLEMYAQQNYSCLPQNPKDKNSVRVSFFFAAFVQSIFHFDKYLASYT